MANYNIYFSPTGGTWKVADVLARNLWGEYANIDLCKEVSPLSLSGDEVCLVSVPSYGGKVYKLYAMRQHLPQACQRL